MPAALSLLTSTAGFNGSDFTAKIQRIYFKITPSGVYVALGDPLDFTTLAGAVISGQPPLFVAITSAKSGGTSGFFYEYSPAAVNPSQANGKFQVLQCAAAGNPAADIGGGAYPAGVIADVITGYADFLRI